jgi:hypothetical protein
MKGLKDRSTVFKDLKYGHDREGGGSSNQPYIKTPINVNLPPAFNFLGSDFILRGGPLGAPLATANDLTRLTKYFTDTKTPSGLLFIAKQNLLSRTAVRTQASKGLVNEGVYTPLSTLAQAGVSAFGFHLNKQGLNPIPGALGSLRTYSDIVQNPTLSAAGIAANVLQGGATSILATLKSLLGGTQAGNLILTDNRLVTLYDNKIQPRYILPNILTYQGGPGSILGVGVTNIKFADQRTGINNPEVFNSGFFKTEEQGYYDFAVFRRIAPTYQASRILNLNGLSAVYSKIVYDDYNTLYSEYNADGDQDDLLNFNPDVYTPDDNGNPTFEPNTEKTSENNTYTYTQKDLIDATRYTDNVKRLVDFRAKLREPFKNNPGDIAFNTLGNAPDYDSQRIELRVNLGDPGNKEGKKLGSYTKGIGTLDSNNKPSTYYGAASETSFDQITVLPLYKSSGPADAKTTNDLVQFRIAAIDNTDPNKKVYMHFRAFLDSFNDAYTGNWSSDKYVGRGENFYTYDGFDRKISLSFTIAAQSKIELIPMYKKLNYLASNLAPDYSGYGLMRGPLVQLTVGGYLRELPGFITSLTYEVVDNASWEIGIDDDGNNDSTYDSTVKELPHMIKVTGFSFTPIHPFVPRKVLDHDDQKSKYIALSTKGHKATDLSNYTTPNITLKDLQNEAANANDTKENPQDI